MDKTKIETFDSSWNPVTGCLHGCEYCYARKIAHRFSGGGENWTDDTTIVLNEKVYGEEEESAIPYPYGFIPTLYRYRLNEYEKKSGRNIFVCSMADLFGEWVPDAWIEEVFAACERAPQHRYIFLTKNPKRYNELAAQGKLPQKHWYGYTAARQKDLWSFAHADECLVENLFVSIEPMLEEMKPGFCSHCPADWVIIGAETGNRIGKVIPKRDWIENIVTECEYGDRPLFMKSSLAEIWGEPLIQEFPDGLKK